MLFFLTTPGLPCTTEVNLHEPIVLTFCFDERERKEIKGNMKLPLLIALGNTRRSSPKAKGLIPRGANGFSR
jgi:hypothetical protein